MNSNRRLRVLVVEDSLMDTELAMAQLAAFGLRPEHVRVETAAALRQGLQDFRPDLIISDFNIPGFSGLAALEVAASESPDTPFIFVSGTIGEERAILSLQKGARDYVLKGNLARLGPAVVRALEESQAREMQRRTQLTLANYKYALDQHAIVSTADLQGRITYANDLFCEISEYTRGELLGQDHRIVNSGYHPKAFMADLWATIESGGTWHGDICNRARSGRLYWVCSSIVPLKDAEGRVEQYLAICADVSDRHVQQERILQLARIQAFMAAANAAVHRAHEPSAYFQEICRAAIDPGGFSGALLALGKTEGGPFEPVAHAGEDLTALHQEMATRVDAGEKGSLLAQALERSRPEVRNDVLNPAAEPVLHQRALADLGLRSLAVLPIQAGAEPGAVLSLLSPIPNAFGEDATEALGGLARSLALNIEHLRAKAELDFLERFDPLTSLPNRESFAQHLDQRFREEGGEGLVLCLNLERFSLVNESFGREAGDAVLRQAALRLSDLMGDPGNITRLGANTFAAFLPGDRDASLTPEFILDALAKPFAAGGEEVRLSARAGCAAFPKDGTEAEALLDLASAALRRCKAENARILSYQPRMTSSVADALKLETRLREAVEQRQFVLHYQPKVSFPDRKIRGVEALIRWQDPTQGLVPPGRFIPLLEETGLIEPVGQWALAQAAADHRKWKAKGLRAPRIAVNVSPLQLLRPDFVDSVRAAIQPGAACGVDLEITESMLVEDIDHSIAKLEALAREGVEIALDDFGTGHSALSYLPRLPVQTIKIDRSFVIHMNERRDHHALIAAILSLAHALGRKVVAEGVETEDQAKALDLLGCDQMQGYHFGRPMPAEALEALLEKEG
jgi:diguanylate cyclase (GGDEF)-like protein/PAS domain S-box-containing protein